MTKQEHRRLIKKRPPAHSGKRYDLQAILILFDNDQEAQLQELFDELHDIDLVELIEELPTELALELLRLVGDERAGDILDDLPDRFVSRLFARMDPQHIQELLMEMSTDDTADYLASLQQDEVARILQGMTPDDREEMQELLRFPADSAGGIMNTEFVAFPREYTVAQALNRLPEESQDAEMIYYIYVHDSRERLVGTLSLRELILAAPESVLGDLAKTNLVKLKVDDDRSEAAEILQHYNLLAVPVVDAEMRLQGIITHDDVADIISAEATEDVYSLAGLQAGDEDDEWELSAWQRAKRRLPWLLICILGGMLSGQVISAFSDALAVVVSLAFFIPVQMDTAGNVATQSVAIVVRGLSTGEIDTHQVLRYALRETLIGLCIGIVCGGILTVSAMLIWAESLQLGLAIGIAMTMTLMVASFLGSVFPLLLHRLKVDPAVASGPLVATILDCVGLVIYFLSAMLILGIRL